MTSGVQWGTYKVPPVLFSLPIFRIFLIDMDTLYVPEIEEAIPLPASATEAFPELDPIQELHARSRTLKFLSDLSGIPIAPDADSIQDAHTLAKAMIENPKLKPDFTKYKNDTLAFLAGMVDAYNAPLVEELSELKHYVINRLIAEIEAPTTTTKERISALSRLGEVDGVNAFQKRTEVTVKIKPIEEIEKELLATLSDLEYKTLQQENTQQIPELAHDGS